MVGIIGENTTRVAVKSGSTLIFSVWVKEDILTNVTCTLTSDSGFFTVNGPLTFTPANKDTPQQIIITAVEDSVVDGFLRDTLLIQFSGGSTSSKTIDITIRDSGMGFKFLNGFNWKKDIDYSLSLSNIAAKRADIFDFLYNGNGKPSNPVPTSITTSYAGTMHGVSIGNLSGVASVTRVTFTMLDNQGFLTTAYGYHIFNSSPNNKLIMCHQGHGSEGAATHELMFNNRLSYGYDLFYMAMPNGGDNFDANPNTNSGNHLYYIEGVDTSTYPRTTGSTYLGMFFFDKFLALDYLDANFSYDNINTYGKYGFIGISGGSYTAFRVGSLDERFGITVGVRGAKHRPFKQAPGPFLDEPDYEQLGAANGVMDNCGPGLYAFGTAYSYPNVVAMCASNGRKVMVCQHSNDVTNLAGFDSKLWEDDAKSLAQGLGGELSMFLDTELTRSAHAYDSYSIARIEEVFGDV